MKRNTKIKDYFAAKSRKSKSSGIMNDVCMAFCLFCILRVGTDDMFYLFIISLRFGHVFPQNFNEINLLTRGLDMVPCKYFKFSK